MHSATCSPSALRYFAAVAFWAGTVVASAAIADESREKATTRVRFETHVRPILKAHCWQCHGEGEELQGTLDSRLARLLIKGGDSGPAIVPGRHAESLLYERVASGEMPPGKKKLSAAELEVLAQWLDSGAETLRPEPESFSAADVISAEDRQHWAFQAIGHPDVPVPGAASSVTSPVDAFLLAALESSQLSFGPAADRETLIRRASFDLTGLPPSLSEIDQFLNDPAADAWPRLIDRLLESPAYGERWGRHWLDVAGYADSDGYTEQDPERKWAYRYRDYVIRAFNSDKPWDRFLIEQIAGDELLTLPYQNLTPEQADQLTATGFLRMGPDGTGDSTVDQNTARNDVVAEAIRIVSTSVLGLSVGCAQCHDHRYDPIPQADYYRLRAVWEPAYDWQNWRAPNARLVSLWTSETQARAADVDAQLKQLNAERNTELDSIVSATFESELLKIPAELHAQARETRETSADKRTPEQAQLIKQYPSLNVDRGSVYLYLPDRLNGFNKKWDARTEETKQKRPDDDFVMCLTEVPGNVPVTRVFSRGDHQTPRQEVAPGELAVVQQEGVTIPLSDPALATTGRRLAYARQLTSGQHPLVARVLVNRFWMHHFGIGLVATAADFGIKGERPSHPELLDWLARDFMDGGWTLKRLHRQIMTSTAYQQSSQRRPGLEEVDPDNRLLGRMSVRRLEAEAVRDAMLAVSGQLVPKPFGPPVPVSPDEVGQYVLAIDTRDSAGRPSGKVEPLGENEFRRSLYAQVRRSMPLGVLEPFDLPLLSPNCEQRAVSTSPPQSLLLMNNPFVLKSADALAVRIQAEAGDDPAAQLRLAWRLVFGRQPAETDLASGVEFLSAETESGTTAPAARPQPGPGPLVQLCHALLCANGFLYVD